MHLNLVAIPLLLTGAGPVAPAAREEILKIGDNGLAVGVARSFRLSGIVGQDTVAGVFHRLARIEEYDEGGWCPVRGLLDTLVAGLQQGQLPQPDLDRYLPDLQHLPAIAFHRAQPAAGRVRLMVGYLLTTRALQDPLDTGAVAHWAAATESLFGRLARRLAQESIRALAPQPLSSAIRTARLALLREELMRVRARALARVGNRDASLVVCVSTHEPSNPPTDDERIYGRRSRIALRSRLDGTFLGGAEAGPTEFHDADALSDLVQSVTPPRGTVLHLGGDTGLAMTNPAWDEGLWPQPEWDGFLTPGAPAGRLTLN